MAGSALTSAVMRKAPLQTARCLFLKPYRGKTRRTVLGRAAGNVVYGGTAHPPATERAGSDKPPPTDARASALPDNFRVGGWKRDLRWKCEPTSQTERTRLETLHLRVRAPAPYPTTVSARWLHRHQSDPAGQSCRRLLQSARHGGAAHQGRQQRDCVDPAVAHEVPQQRGSTAASCAGLKSRQLHAHPGSAGGGQALVADLVAAKAGEDWRQDRRPRPVRHVPDGRGCGAGGPVRRNPAADSSTPGAASTSVRRSLMPMLQQTTGEVRFADHKRRHQRAGIAVLTAIPTNSRRIPSRTAPKIASVGDPNYRLLTNRGPSGECRLRTRTGRGRLFGTGIPK